MTSISIPASVSSMIDNGFWHCPSLENVYITDIVAYCNIDFGSDGPFEYEVAKMYLNNQLLTELIIPEGVKEIKDFAFDNLKSITKVVIPNSVTYLGESAFRDCDALTSAVIGDGIKTIHEDAFYDCDVLTTVVLGKGVEDIARGVFADCAAITEFYCYATTPPSIVREFTNGYENTNTSIGPYDVKATLYVPERCGSAYKSSAWGKAFKNIKEMD